MKYAKVKKIIVYTIIYIALVVLAITCLIPLWLTVVNSTRSGKEVMMGFSWLPGNSLAENWAVLASQPLSVWRGYWNSLIIAVPCTLLSSYFSALTGFALAVYKFKGRNVIFYTIVIFMMIPGQLGLIGFYNLCAMLHITNTYIPLILPAIASTGTVFFLRQYVLSVLPLSLLEAGRIDGAKEIYMFHKIVIPIMMPGIATMAIGAFIGSWNSYLVPMLILNDQKKYPLPYMVKVLSNEIVNTNYGARYLLFSMSLIPVIIVFCFFSRYIISSISAGSVKE